MAVDTRRQRKLVTIGDENKKADDIVGKPNVIKAKTEIKRSVLGDIAGNRLAVTNSKNVGISNQLPYKSRLPVLKGILKNPAVKASATLKTSATVKASVISKSKVIAAKENQTSTEVKSSNVVSIIDKTKTLKIDGPKYRERPANVDDIDKEDHKNPFLVSIYANDIYDYLKVLERSHPIKEDYLNGREISPKVRGILVDWLVEVQSEYDINQETLHIAVGILDTYLQNTKPINKKFLQLIGVTALFLAAKYEQITVPCVDELVYISASSFKDSDLYDMEREIFKTINFDLSRPISLSFLRRYSKAASAKADQHSYAKYFLELSLIEYSLCHVYPSVIAASALCLALFITNNKNASIESVWTKTLEFYSGYQFKNIKNIINVLAKCVISAKDSKLQAVGRKYSSSSNFRVSLQPCLQSDRIKLLAISE